MTELGNAVTDLTVVDRPSERIGTVEDLSLGRRCVLVAEPAPGFRRKRTPSVHPIVAGANDVDTFTIVLLVDKQDVLGGTRAAANRQLGERFRRILRGLCRSPLGRVRSRPHQAVKASAEDANDVFEGTPG